MATKINALMGETMLVKTLGQTANDSVIIPAGYQITDIAVVNNTANAITGGLKIGTTDGGADVVLALSVLANVILGIADATILKKLFSKTVDTTLYINSVIGWNSANIDVVITTTKIF